MTEKKYREYIKEQGLFDFRDKENNINLHTFYMLMRTQKMFHWEGLPETIPERMLEQYIQINGFTGIADVDGNLYAFYGGLGGVPDEYYQPTIFTVANPYLRFNENLKIDEDCALILNDTFYLGLIPLFNRYASMLAENELSMHMAGINTRVQMLLSAGDDATREAAQKFIDDLERGKLSAVMDNAFLNTLKTMPMTTSGNTNILGDLIENEQYIKASWYNEVGLNANYNMKREALNTAETTVNNDILFPLVEEMLEERQKGAERVNKMFGTDISVELSSSWRDNRIEEDETIDDIKDDQNDNAAVQTDDVQDQPDDNAADQDTKEE